MSLEAELIVKRAFIMLAISLGLSTTGCGTAKRSRAVPGDPLAKLEQVTTVSPELGPIDPDDEAVLHFGHPATVKELGEITEVIRRYYAVAVAADGAKACSMLFSPAARSVVDEEGRLPELRGTTCAVVMSKLFKQHHRQLVTDLDSLRAVRVRTGGLNGSVVLRVSNSNVSRELSVRRVGKAWKLGQALDEPMR